MADSDERTNEEDPMQGAVTSPLSSRRANAESALRQARTKAVIWLEAIQKALDKVRANERDACAAAEAEVQSAEAEVQSAEAEVQSARAEVQSAQAEVQSAQAEVQSAEKALKQAEEHLYRCRNQLVAENSIRMQVIAMLEDKQRKTRSHADANIKRLEDIIDEARQEEMGRDASVAGESA